MATRKVQVSAEIPRRSTGKNGNSTIPETPVGAMVQIHVPRIEIRPSKFEIEGIMPLLSHRFSQEQLQEIRDKQQGKPKGPRKAKNPMAEFHSSLYPIGPSTETTMEAIKKGRYGMKAVAFKKATVGGVGVLQDKQTLSMTLARKLFFFKGCADAPELVEIFYDDLVMREDPVTVGNGGTDLRYRAEFHGWRATLDVSFLTCLTPEMMGHLINLGGFCCGVGDWRPELGGVHGQYRLKEE